MTAHHRSRALMTRMRTLGAGCLVTLVALAGAQSASAESGTAQIADGLHVSTGGITAPDGRQWVADHNAGFCRLGQPTETKLGTIEHPQLPGAPEAETRTCLGGLLPDAGPGPDAAGQPAFYDPTPDFANSGDEIALIPDGASPSLEVYRAHYNPITHLFEIDPALDVISMDADPDPQAGARPRPNSISIGPDGNAYVTFQRSATIQRISHLDAPAPTVDLIGATTDGKGALGVAAGYGPFGPLGPPTVYFNEASGQLRQIAGLPGSAAEATPYSPGTRLLGQLMYVPQDTIAGTGALFAGTTEALLPGDNDDVVQLHTDGPPTVTASGFNSIGGFGLRPPASASLSDEAAAQRLVVYDDPAIVTPGEPLGLGRAWSVGGPYTHLATGPSQKDGQPSLDPDYTADSTPTFTYTGDGAARECSLVLDTAATNSFSACDPLTFTRPAALADGRWRFAVRTTLGTGPGKVTGPAAVRRFTVDTVAPTAKPIVVNPKRDSTSLRSPRYVFDADSAAEPLAGFACKLDDLDPAATDTPDFVPCAEGIARTPGTDDPLPAPGTYAVQIKLVDAAGNVGTQVSDGIPTVADDPATTDVDENAASVGDQPTPFQVGPDPIADADATDPVPYPEMTHPNSAVRYAEGLHVPTGAMEDPKGRIWVADHNGGFCRITDPTIDGPGQIEHPSVPGEPRSRPRTCLGGLLPDAGPGADAAGPPTFYDPTPRKRGNGDELVFIADGFAQSNYLVRFRWDPGTEKFDYVDQILVPALDRPVQDRARPVTSQLGPDPDGSGLRQPSLYFSNKRDSYIGRVDDLTSAAPQVHIAGFVSTGGDRAEVLGVGQRGPEGDRHAVLYFTDQNGTARIETPAETGDAVAGQAATTGVPYVIKRPNDAVVAPAAMQYDFQRDLLYVGTSDGLLEADQGIDHVIRWNPNTDASTSEVGGFTMVQGIGLRNDGRILVVEDKALLDPAEPLAQGVMWQIGGPSARIVSGPSNAGKTSLDPSYTADTTPTFGLAGDQDLQCWFRNPGTGVTSTSFTPCTAATVTAPDLGQGQKLLTVRSTAGATPATQEDATRFVPVTLRYTVDTTAPVRPAATLDDGEVVNNRTTAEPSFKFTGVELGNRLECRLVNSNNTGPPNAGTFNKAPCRQGKAFPRSGTPRVTEGANRVSVRQIDKAGNASPESTQLSFQADATVPIVTISSPAADDTPVGSEAQFTFKTNDTGTIQYGCRLDGQTFQSCDEPGADDGGPGQPFAVERLADGSIRVTYRNLGGTDHAFSVHARDEHDNISPNATRRVHYDPDAPAAIIDTPAPNTTTGPSTTAVFHVDPNTTTPGEAITLTCTLRRGTTVVAIPATCQSGALALTGLQSGEHTLTVQARDATDNVGPVASRTWTVDATGPAITITKTATGLFGLGFPNFSFTADEPGTFTCAFDGRPFLGCGSVNSAGLSTGQHTFRVRGVDAFGNVGNATNTFTFVGNAPPTKFVPGPPAATLRADTVTLAAARATGLPVTVTPGERTTFTQLTVLQAVTPTAAAAAAKKKAKTKYRRVGQITRKTPKTGHKYKLRLDDRKLRKALKAGNYRIDVRGKDKKNRLSDPTRLKLRIKR